METSDEEAWLLLRPNSKTDNLQQLLRKRELIVALLKAQENLIRDAQHSIQNATLSIQQGQSPIHAHQGSQPAVISGPAGPVQATFQQVQQTGLVVTNTSQIQCEQLDRCTKQLHGQPAASQKHDSAVNAFENTLNKVQEPMILLLPQAEENIQQNEPISVPCSPCQHNGIFQPPAMQGQVEPYEQHQPTSYTHASSGSLQQPVTELPDAMPDFTPPKKLRRHSHHHHHHHQHQHNSHPKQNNQQAGQYPRAINGTIPPSNGVLLIHPTYDETLEVVPATPCSPSPVKLPIENLVTPGLQQTKQALFIGDDQRVGVATTKPLSAATQQHPLSHQQPCHPTSQKIYGKVPQGSCQQALLDEGHMRATNQHTDQQSTHMQKRPSQVLHKQHDDEDTEWRHKSSRKRNKTAAVCYVEHGISHKRAHHMPEGCVVPGANESKKHVQQSLADETEQIPCPDNEKQCLQPVSHTENIPSLKVVGSVDPVTIQMATGVDASNTSHTQVIGVQLPCRSDKPHQQAKQRVGEPNAPQVSMDCMQERQCDGGCLHPQEKCLHQPTIIQLARDDDVASQQLSGLSLQENIIHGHNFDEETVCADEGAGRELKAWPESRHSLDIQEITLPGTTTALCASECGNFLATLLRVDTQRASKLQTRDRNNTHCNNDGSQDGYELRLFHTVGNQPTNEACLTGLTTLPELKEAACLPLQIRSTLSSKKLNLQCPVALIQPQLSDSECDQYEEPDGCRFDALGMPHDRQVQSHCELYKQRALQSGNAQYNQLPVAALCSALTAVECPSMDPYRLLLMTWIHPAHTDTTNCCQQCQLRGSDQGIAQEVCKSLVLNGRHVQGHWKQLEALQSQAVMYSVLQLDNTTLIAAGEAGNACMWTLRFATAPASHCGRSTKGVMLETAEFYRLPQARIAGTELQDIVQMCVLPSSPHVVMGSTQTCSFALWDTHRRQCLLAQHHPTPLTHQLIPVNFMNGGMHDTGVQHDAQQPNDWMRSPGIYTHTPTAQCKRVTHSAQKQGSQLQTVGLQPPVMTPCQPTKLGVSLDGCGRQSLMAGCGVHAAGVSRLGRASGGSECQTDRKPHTTHGGVASGGLYHAPSILPQPNGFAARTPAPALQHRQQQPQTALTTCSTGPKRTMWTTPYTTRASSAIRKGVVVQWHDEILSSDHPLVLISVASAKVPDLRQAEWDNQQVDEVDKDQHMCAGQDVLHAGSVAQDVLQISVVSSALPTMCADICRQPRSVLSIAALNGMICVMSDADITLVDMVHGGNIWQVQLSDILNDQTSSQSGKQNKHACETQQLVSKVDLHTLINSRRMVPCNGTDTCKLLLNSPPSVLFVNERCICAAINSKLLYFAW